MQETITHQLDFRDTLGVAVLSFDMKTAFDSLDHAKLLQSLSEGDLPTGFLEWLANFLTNRRQQVLLQGVTGSCIDVTSGVPQGSVLAPSLFAAHMGSLQPVSPTSEMIKYADDVVVLHVIKENANFSDDIKAEIENMTNWCNSHGLSLNVDKTKVMVISKNVTLKGNLPMTCVDNCKILGVTFQDNLKWDSHIHNVVRAASCRIHVLRKLKELPSASKMDLRTIYENFILSVLEYNSPLLVGLNQKNNAKLEKIRKRCHRIICGAHCRCDVFECLSARRDKTALKVFQKLLSPSCLIHYLTPPFLRSSKRLDVPVQCTSRRSSSFIPYCVNLFNQQK